MKRRLILLILTIAILAGFGALLHSPPSVLDVVSGATPKSKKKTQTVAELEGAYIFCINSDSNEWPNRLSCDEWKDLILDESEALSETSDDTYKLYVSEEDTALLKYAETLCERLEKSGIDVEVKTFSDIMLRSRIVGGRYEIFLASTDLIDAEQLVSDAYFLLDSSEMR